jgi:hypothetical protein
MLTRVMQRFGFCHVNRMLNFLVNRYCRKNFAFMELQEHFAGAKFSFLNMFNMQYVYCFIYKVLFVERTIHEQKQKQRHRCTLYVHLVIRFDSERLYKKNAHNETLFAHTFSTLVPCRERSALVMPHKYIANISCRRCATPFAKGRGRSPSFLA